MKRHDDLDLLPFLSSSIRSSFLSQPTSNPPHLAPLPRLPPSSSTADAAATDTAGAKVEQVKEPAEEPHPAGFFGADKGQAERPLAALRWALAGVVVVERGEGVRGQNRALPLLLLRGPSPRPAAAPCQLLLSRRQHGQHELAV